MDFYSGLNYSIGKPEEVTSNKGHGKWAKHRLSLPLDKAPPRRRSRQLKFQNLSNLSPSNGDIIIEAPKYKMTENNEKHTDTVNSEIKMTEKSHDADLNKPDTVNNDLQLDKPKRKRRALRPRKALITLSANARRHLQQLLDQPEPKLIRIGVRNRGCSGLTYNLEYVDKPGKFDEIVEQDGVKVVIDSKALFSIVGSEMDWLDDKLSSKFIFKNPNSKGTCGCGESFMV